MRYARVMHRARGPKLQGCGVEDFRAHDGATRTVGWRLPPPVTRTLPSRRSVASGRPRFVVMSAVAVNFPVAGSYSSASSVTPCPIHPPTIKTFPDAQ